MMVAKICLIDKELIKEDTLLFGELKMDSIKIIELLALLSEEYDIHATEHDAANFNTFSDLYAFTQKTSELL
jgi:acyl carrier protein